MRLVMLLLLGGSANAEPSLEEMRRVVEAAHPRDTSSNREYDSAMKLQMTGAMFMGAGIVHLFGNTIATGYAIEEASFLRNCARTRQFCEGWGLGVAAASVTFALGAIFTIVGIPTYIEGTTRLHKMKLRAELAGGGARLTF
jgi:hypothetical protein